jgi:hypothetical protein
MKYISCINIKMILIDKDLVLEMIIIKQKTNLNLIQLLLKYE